MDLKNNKAITHGFTRIMESMSNVNYNNFKDNLDLQEICLFNLILILENVNDSDKTLLDKCIKDYQNKETITLYNTLTTYIPTLYKKLFS